MISVLDAAYRVLAEVGEPTHVLALTERILASGLWTTSGKTPAASVESALAVDIARRGAASRFVRTGRRIYALNPEVATPIVVHPNSMSGKSSLPRRSTTARQGLTFLEAAAKVLEDEANRKPLHYRSITERAIQRGLLTTNGATPEATLYAQILTDIARRQARGDPPRFAKFGRGMVGLAVWSSTGLDSLIANHNMEVRKRLLQYVRSMSAVDFEQLVGVLLTRMGFASVVVTNLSGDGGIDARGELVIGDAVRIKMAVQAKRWQGNVQRPVVQQVRGSLDVHEHGLIITTGDFSPKAREDANEAGRTPIGLMNGDQLVALLVEHQILVHRAPYELLELAPDAPAGE